MKNNFLFAVILLMTASCAKDKVPPVVIDPNCPDTISFAAKIQPLVSANCSTSGCHDANTQASGYNFTSYETISSNAAIMLSAMRSESGVVPMPQGGPQLPDSLIQQFSCWTNQGKQNN